MPKEKVPFEALKTYVPEGAFDDVLYYLQHYKVQLTVSRQRQTILGDYRHAHGAKNHRISVNGNLNKYAFLVTLLHELAHLFTYERFGHRVMSHGKEWKHEFGKILFQFLQKNIFPQDISQALNASLHNPAASSCADEALQRILKKYDDARPGFCMVEDLEPGAVFRIKGNRVFRKGNKVRTRYKCQELSNNKWFLFSAVYEVEQVPTQ